MRQEKPSKKTKKTLNRLLCRGLLYASTAFLYHNLIFIVWLEPQTFTFSFLNSLILAVCALTSKNWSRMPLAMNHLVIAHSLLLIEISVKKSLVPVSKSIFLLSACQKEQKRTACLAFFHCHPYLQAGDSILNIFALKKNLFNPIFPVQTSVLTVA